MKIIFKTDRKPSGIEVKDVPEDRLFIDHGGYLCLKAPIGYVIIADPKGQIRCDTRDALFDNMGVSRILPEVERIEF